MHDSEADIITQLYRGLLRRDPDPAGLAGYSDALRNGRQLSDILDSVVHSTEFSAKFDPASASPFYHYNAALDAQAIIRRHAVPGLKPRPGYLTNFLGVLVDPKFFPHILAGRGGQVEGVPIPGNWHADIAEWAGALRAVELAREKFTVIELGCGWGCWLNSTGAAARRVGLAVTLIGVEGDRDHLAFAREACAINGFRPDQLILHHGIAAAQTGVALFPRQHQAGVNWGLEPVFGASAAAQTAAIAAGSHDALPMISLDALTSAYQRIDLLHIDIQGGEAYLIASSLTVLTERVAYIFIGTHSRQIEGRIMEILLAEGWVLEIERPAFFHLRDGKPVTYVDGAQAWRNPRLT